jgi:hypothetical protein
MKISELIEKIQKIEILKEQIKEIKEKLSVTLYKERSTIMCMEIKIDRLQKELDEILNTEIITSFDIKEFAKQDQECLNKEIETV